MKTLSTVKKKRETVSRKAGWYEVFKDGKKHEAFWLFLERKWSFYGINFKDDYFDEIGEYLG